MKKLITVTLLTLILSMASFAQTVEFEKTITKYDKFKDFTSVNLKLAISKDSNEFFLLIINGGYDGKTPKPSLDNETLFSFTSMSGRKQPVPSSRSWIVLADNERINFGDGEYENQLLGNMFISTLAYYVSENNLKKIANAKKVEMQVGNKEFTLTESQLTSLKEFYKQLVP